MSETATFAGGCFWCMQPSFDAMEGVLSAVVGYMGGQTDNPTYDDICTGTTGHAEVIQITFDPHTVSYSQLLNIFWMNIDPTTLNQQFADTGTQYRTAIFYHSDEQKNTAEESKEKLNQSELFEQTIVTEITPASTFYKGEEYHQDYYKKNPLHYNRYKQGSGRSGYIEAMYGNNKRIFDNNN